MDHLTIILLGAACFFIGATGLPLLHYDHWTVRLFDFPRVQLTIGATATLGGLGLVGLSSLVDFVIAGLLGASIVYQIDRILPYTPLAPQQVRSASPELESDRLSVLVANVERDNRDAEALLTLVKERRPDLVFAVETDAWWAEQLRALDELYPHRIEQPQENAYGMVLYARRPLKEAEVRCLVEEDVPSIHAQVSLAAGPSVYLHCMHPRPPHPTHDPDTTERDAELLHLARQIRDREAPTLVVGDLNDVSWSYTTRLFQRLSGLLDPRVGRGAYNTFHARYPLFRYPLDHVFHSPHFRLVDLDVLPYIGSDHFPVYIDLQYDPEAPDAHPEPEADASDEAQADHELQKLQEKKGSTPNADSSESTSTP